MNLDRILGQHDLKDKIYNSIKKNTYPQSKIIIDMFGKFKQTLKILDLKIVSFVFGFNSNINKYIYFYEVRSKKYNTPDLRIDGVVADSNFPFVFFPQMFASLMISILNNVPHNLLVEVSEGR